MHIAYQSGAEKISDDFFFKQKNARRWRKKSLQVLIGIISCIWWSNTARPNGITCYPTYFKTLPILNLHLHVLYPKTISANPRLLRHKAHSRHPDSKIRDYIIRLSQDRGTTFGSTIENFIQCTSESQETNPFIVTRNVSFSWTYNAEIK